MKQRNRFLALLLCFSMLLSLIPGTAFAVESTPDTETAAGVSTVSAHSDTSQTADNVCGDGLTWAIDGHTLTISSTGTGTGAMYDYDWNEKYPPWYGQTNAIRTVVLEEGVTHVGSSAFCDFEQLSKMVIYGDPPTWGEYPIDSAVQFVLAFFPREKELAWTEDHFDNAEAAGITYFAYLDTSTSGSVDYVNWAVDGSTLTITPLSDEECPMVDYLDQYYMDQIDTIRIDNSSGLITTIGAYAFYTFPYANRVYFVGDCPDTFGESCFYGNEIFYYPADNSTWKAALDGGTLPGYASDWVPYSSTPATSGTFTDGTDTMNWNLSGDTLTISGTGNMPELDNWAQYPWSLYNEQIKHLVIGEGVTSVAPGSFGFQVASPAALDSPNPNYAIQTISFPSTLTWIGECAFSGCTQLDRVVLPESLTTIRGGAFYGCSALNEITIPSSVELIDYQAFAYCTALSQLTFDPNIRDIILSYDCFGGCTALTEVAVPLCHSDTVSAFSHCTNLSSVTFAEGTTTIYWSMFSGCSALKQIAIPDTVTTIEGYAFRESGLTSIEIPTGVTSIGDSAFQDCQNLTSVTFHPQSKLTSIGWYAFSGSGLTQVSVPAGCTLDTSVFCECLNLTDVVVADGVTTIPSSTFSGCTALKRVTIPASLTTVENYAFENTALEQVHYLGLPADWSKITIGNYNDPLINATKVVSKGENWYLTSNGTLTVTHGVFDDTPLQDTPERREWVSKIQILDQVTDIANGAFSLYTDIYLAPSSLDVSSSANLIFKEKEYILSGDGKRLILLLPGTDEITIPASVTSIDPYAFANCGSNFTKTAISLKFQGDAPELAEHALDSVHAKVDISISINPYSNGWTYPEWNGFPTSGNGIVDSISLDADNLSGEKVTMSAQTKMGFPSIISLYYSLDGENWTKFASSSSSTPTAAYSYTFSPKKLNIPADAASVWFTAAAANQQLGEVEPIQVPVEIPVPSPITGLTARQVDMNLVTLAWDMIPETDTDLFSHFLVERKSGDGQYSTYDTIYPSSSGALTCGLNDTSVRAATQYSYRVTSVYSSGYTSQSAEITVTTLPDTVNPSVSKVTPVSDSINSSFYITAKVNDNDGLAAVLFSYSLDEGKTWTDLESVTVSGTSAEAKRYCSIANLPDGPLRVRAIAQDRSGNLSAEYAVGYVIDRVAPAPPVLNEVTDKTTKVLSLTWSVPTDTDLSHFLIYISQDEKTWSDPVSCSANGYTCRGLTPNTTYYFRVTSVDTTGNEGEPSAVISATTLEDKTAPAAPSISPASGHTIGPDQTILAHASDETALGSLTIYYRAQGSDSWLQLATRTTSSTSADLKTTPKDLPSGVYEFRAGAVDGAGNASPFSETVTYTLDATPPQITAIEAVAGVEQVTITWTTPNEADLAGFYLYRNGSQIASVTNENKTNYTYTNTLTWDRCQNHAYTYSVTAVDVCGNSSSLTTVDSVYPTATPDVTAPVAYINLVDSVFVNEETFVSCTGSYDDRAIVSYEWDMGDGTRYSGKTKTSFRHTYTQGGTYTVTLTATDAAGNSVTVMDSIYVISENEYTTPTITVLGYESDSPAETYTLSGAQVVFDLGGENISYYTSGNGTVSFRRLEEGTFHIGAYKDGYLPASADITMVHGQPVAATLKLEKKPIVTGSLTTRELTYQEIVDLGIDVTAPSNQNVYHFSASIDIGGNITQYDYYYNDEGNEVGGGANTPVKKVRVGSSSYTIKPNVLKASRPARGDDDDSGSSAGGSRATVNIPYVTVLEIPGTVSVLKQFYEAELTVINQADAEFAFDNSRATLHIPDGLTLIPTETTASSSTTPMTQPGQSQGVIYGQGSASTKWVLRGDESGEYDLSATFRATLRDFDASISAQFKAEDSIVVRGSEDVHLDMYISNTMLDRTYFVDLELYCDVGTLNLPEISLGNYTPDQIAVRSVSGSEHIPNGTVTELHEGETLIYRYMITVDESVPLLFQSNLLKGSLESEEMQVNSYVRNITKFELFEGSFDLTEMGVFIKTLPSLPHAEAVQFWQFLHNTNLQPPADDMCYRILSGSLQDYDGTLEELRLHILSMFETIRARLNVYVRSSNDRVGFLSTEISNALWESIGVNPEDDAWENARSSALEELTDGMKEMFCDIDNISNEALLSLQGITIGVSSLSDTSDTIEKIINGMEYAVQTIGLTFNSEYSGRYAYFNFYLNNRLDYETPSDGGFQLMLSAAVTTLAQQYWASELLDTVSWITGKDSWTNHTDTIEQWAELLYQLEVVALYYDNAGDEGESTRQDFVELTFRTSDENSPYATSSLSFPYSWTWFQNSSTQFNQKLAALTLGMVMAGSSTSETDDRYTQTVPIGTHDRAQNIRTAYQMLGFRDDAYYNYEDPLSSTEDKVAFSIAHRTLENGEPLVAVFLRGGQYGAEWASNFNVGSQGNHTGFDTAATEVVFAVNQYLLDHNLSGADLKIWLGGYSRAAATANLVGHYLLDNSIVSTDNLYAYTFATPNGFFQEHAEAGPSTAPERCIFNIVSPHDVVPKLALNDWGFTKYGRTLLLPTGNAGIQSLYPAVANAKLAVSTETRYLSELIESFMSACIIDRDHYVDHAQDAIIEANAKEFADADGSLPLLSLLASMLKTSLTDSTLVAPRLRAEELFNAVSECMNNGIKVMDAHYMEYYLTWMRYGQLDTISDFEKMYTVYSLCVECPVDVEVYDSNNTLVAHIKDNQVLVDKVPAAVVGDAKVVYLYDQEYRVVLTGNDTGSMTYTIREYDADQVVRELRYYDLPLTDGAQYTQTIVPTDATSLTAIVFGEESIPADVDSQSTEVPGKYLIGVVNGTCELTAAAPGTTVTAAAQPTVEGQPFAYWTVQSDDSTFTLPQNSQQTISFVMPNGAVRLEAVYDSVVEITDTAVVTEGETTTVTASFSYMLNDGSSPVAICAFYDADGRLTDSVFQMLDFGTQTVSFQITSPFTTARLYVLDSKETLRPLCPAKTVS